MQIILGKTKSGKTSKMLELFLNDENSSVFISDEEKALAIREKALNISKMSDGAKELKNKTIIWINELKGLEDYCFLLGRHFKESIYLDIKVPKEFDKEFKSFCARIEWKYACTITICEQASLNSSLDGIEILYTK